MSLFGTNGVRGILGDTMHEGIAERLGKAVGTWLPDGASICIGRDARESGPALQAAFARGVHSTGVHTSDVGVCPSPGIQLWVRDQRLAAGAIITASHNPAEYNGIKLIAPDGTETSADEEAAVEALYESQEFRTGAGHALPPGNAVDHYLDAVLAQVDVPTIRAAKLRAVLDPGGGAGCVTAPRLLAALGVETIELSCTLDGNFGDRPSEPTPENSAACIAAVRKHGADIGMLQDGDADRAVFIDEQGGYVWGDTSLALGALHEMPRHPRGSAMCTAVSSSSCVADIVERVGGTLHWTVVGSPVVAREMIRVGAVFGGEDNGGLMFTRHQVCRDGLMAMAFMLELIATTGRPFSELCAEIPRYALVKQKIPVPEARKQQTLAAFEAALKDAADILRVDNRDGVKLYVKNGWALVRPSGTEAVFRVQAEAPTEQEASAIAARFRGLLEAVA